MKPLYFTRLDTLRFFAFFLVFWQHGFANCFNNLGANSTINRLINAVTFTGGTGVHIFFVISGFLITLFLIKEQHLTGKINTRNFYTRRVLRIWPLYYLVLLAGIFVLPHFIHTFQFCGNIFKDLCFLNNFDIPSLCNSGNINIAWSVAIEEQFYLCWPILFMLFYKRKLLPRVCFAFYAVSTVYILTHMHTAYFHTLGNMNYLMAGCMGAVIYTTHQKRISSSRLLHSSTFYFAVIFAVALTLLQGFYVPLEWLAVMLMPFVYAFIIIYLVARNGAATPSVFSNLGKYTYGMYMYHPTIIIFTKIAFDLLLLDYRGNGVLNFALALLSLALTIGISVLSYEYFEKYFLKFKRRFSLVETRI